MKFTEERLEKAIIELLETKGIPHVPGGAIERSQEDVLLQGNLREHLAKQYAKDDITSSEIESIIQKLERLPASDLY
ncbi:MAG: hypothetical protein Q9M25_03435 [Mariprofundaceae bacterium]|nr:hypothetical protein [Mariprofundaceae bacterium]